MKNIQLDEIESYPYKEFIIIPIRKEVSKLIRQSINDKRDSLPLTTRQTHHKKTSKGKDERL